MKAFFFIIGLILAGVLAYSYVPRVAQVIEYNVAENVKTQLASENLPVDVQINVYGRDVNISGSVDSEQDKSNLVNKLQSVEGVRKVVADLDVADEKLEPVVETNQSPMEMPMGEEIADNEFLEFEPLDDEPLFDFLAEDYVETEEDIVEADVAEFEESQAPEIEEEVAVVVEETAEEVQGMIEEPAVPEAPEIEEEVAVVVEETAEEVQEMIEETTVPEEPKEEDLAQVETELKKTTTECQAEISNLVAGKRVNFETGQSKIEKSSLPLLNSIVKEMAGCSDMALHIHGHTDNVGDEAVNRKLSHSRAKSVGLYLLKKGVTQRIKIFGHGDDQPIASNDNEEGRETNRRIEFTVTDFDDSVATDDPKTVKTKQVPRLIKEHTIIAQ